MSAPAQAPQQAAPNEFQSKGFFKDRYICYKRDLRRAVKLVRSRAAGRAVRPPSMLKSRFSARRGKQLVLREGLAVAGNEPSWFYTAFERGARDPLTNFALEFIENNIPKEARLLITGCGTGITVFHLADCGFREILGIDILPECIAVANRIRDEYGYDQVSFRQDDCFRPKLDGCFDVVTVMHWVFSAWAGNYRNKLIDPQEARRPEVREQLLESLLAKYAPHLNPSGLLIIELTDAVADYRIASDHPYGDRSLDIYPVRHTPEQVGRCAQASGLSILDKKLCVTYGHHPRTSYVLKKDHDT